MATDIDQARDHLRQAARSFGDRLGERLVGGDTIHHLRQAAKHVLLAGVEAIDKAEARSAKAEVPPAPPAAPAEAPTSGCCG